MNKYEIINALKNLPEDANIWIGADTGEGWIPLDEVFVCNALDAPLDGDEVGNGEIEYLDRENSLLEPSWEVEDDYPEDKEIRVGKPIIIVGERGSQCEVDANKNHRLADKDQERLKYLAIKRKEFQAQIDTIKAEEKLLKKK